MNYNDLMLPALLIVYAAFGYHRRERAHKERMELLKRDREPPEPPQGSVLARIITYGVIATLLLGMIYLFTILGLGQFRHFSMFYLWPAAFTVLLVFVVLILIRDITSYRTTHKL